MGSKRNSERRSHKRFKMSNNAVAFSHGTAGRLLEISTGGLSVRFFGKDLTSKIHAPTYMTLSDHNFNITGIPVDLLWVSRCEKHPVNSIPVHKARIQFKELSDFQKSQIEKFIELNKKEEV